MAKLPNIILIGIDNLRFDLVSSFPDKRYLEDFVAGQTLPETPTLDAFARESFWFQTCVAVAGYTPPSFATAFTGTYPYRHGLVDFTHSRVRDNISTVFQIFQQAGYRTVAQARDTVLFERNWPGMQRGLERVCGGEDELFAFIEEDRTRPVLVFVHFLDCHTPFLWTESGGPGANDDFYSEMERLYGEDLRALLPDEAQVTRRAEQLVYGPQRDDTDPAASYSKVVELYLKSVQKFDRNRLASFFGALADHGLWNDSYIVAFSDHGEIKHPVTPYRTEHGPYLREDLTRVVCMLRGPDIVTGASTQLVGLVDLLPTLIELVGPEAQRGVTEPFDGRSLAPLARGERQRLADAWYMQEGWFYRVGWPATPPVRFERAVRTPNDLRYVFRGDAADLSESRGMGGNELRRWFAETFYPARWEVPSDRERLFRAFEAAGGGEKAALHLLMEREKADPRYAIYDLRADPYQRDPLRVSFAPELWPDYLEKYRWMLERSASCEPRASETTQQSAELSDEEGEDLVERLRALGYHD